MKVTEITVSAGRTFSHPYESYSNLKPFVSLKATLDADDDPVKATRDLQAQAETIVEDHKRNMLASLAELRELSLKQQEIAQLDEQIKRAQMRLDAIRQGVPQLTQQEGLAFVPDPAPET